MTVKTIEVREDAMKSDRIIDEDSRKDWAAMGDRSVADFNNYSRSNEANASKLKTIARSEIQRQKGLDGSHDPESFHCAIGRILIVAQCFGVLPVYGVLEPSPKALAFRKLSLRTAYALLLTTMLTIVTIGALLHMFKSLNRSTFEIGGGIGSATAGAVFYGNSLIGLLMFFRLSSRWASLQSDWQAVERLVDLLRWGRPKLRRKFSLITGVVLLCAVLEHVLSVLKNTPSYKTGNENGTAYHFLEEYSNSSHNFITNIWNYHLVWGIFIFIVSKVATFIWNFTDVFIILVSTGLAERYKMLNRRFTSKRTAAPTTREWKMMRECYAALSALVKRVDDDVSPIVLLSFANNLYFICLQLLNGISKSEDADLINGIYFFGSFGFLVARTIGVTISAARIHDQSRVALPALYTCTSTTYSIETQRLEHQLATDTIALSGLSFFWITRNFMLAVAGAIVTYEVVLLQFDMAMNHN